MIRNIVLAVVTFALAAPALGQFSTFTVPHGDATDLNRSVQDAIVNQAWREYNRAGGDMRQRVIDPDVPIHKQFVIWKDRRGNQAVAMYHSFDKKRGIEFVKLVDGYGRYAEIRTRLLDEDTKEMVKTIKTELEAAKNADEVVDSTKPKDDEKVGLGGYSKHRSERQDE